MHTPDTHPPELLDVVRTHIEKTGLSKSAFGEKAVGDRCFVFDLEKGRESRRKTVARVTEFIKTGLTWEDAKAGVSPDDPAGGLHGDLR